MSAILLAALPRLKIFETKSEWHQHVSIGSESTEKVVTATSLTNLLDNHVRLFFFFNNGLTS